MEKNSWYYRHRDEWNEKRRAKYKENPEQAKQDTRTYYKEHREEILAKIKADNVAHPEKRQEKRRRMYAKHKEKILTANKIWRDENPDKVKETRKRWEAENSQCLRLNWRIANHRKRTAEGNFTATEILELFRIQENLCYYCRKPFFNGTLKQEVHIEHKTPLVKGGTNNIENIVLACPDCNKHKYTKTDEEFMS